jgi:lysophospholipase L1-like esterase
MNTNFQTIKADASPSIATSGAQMETAFNGNFDKVKDNFIEQQQAIDELTPDGNISRWAGKKFSIVGDSYSDYSGYSVVTGSAVYPRGDVDSVDKIWWQIVGGRLGMTLLVNNSIAGTGIFSGSSGFSVLGGNRHLALHDGNTNPDVIFFMIGGNDYLNGYPLGEYNGTGNPPDGDLTDFRSALYSVLRETSYKYENAWIYVVTYPQYLNNNSKNITLYEWNNATKEIAAAAGVMVMDCAFCPLMMANSDQYTQDGVHPNATGFRYFADFLSEKLLTMDSGNTGAGTLSEPQAKGTYNARVRNSSAGTEWRDIFKKHLRSGGSGSDAVSVVKGVEGLNLVEGLLKPYCPLYFQDNSKLKNVFIDSITLKGSPVAASTLFVLGYRNIDSIAAGNTPGHTMDGWYCRIQLTNGVTAEYMLNGTDSNVELNEEELADGKIFIPSEGRILAFGEYNSATVQECFMLNATDDESAAVDSKIYAVNASGSVIQMSNYRAGFIVKATTAGEEQFVYEQPDLQDFHERISRLEATVSAMIPH